jgi:hypothetical protein
MSRAAGSYGPNRLVLRLPGSLNRSNALIEVQSNPTRGGHDGIIWRDELQERLGGVSTKTLKRYIDAGRLPPPDLRISLKRVGWKFSTLAKAGLEALCY